ncbi:MAG: NAD(P)H-hydrate dehydratase, partial [Candidatus Nanopelagicaceae bacterium]
MKPENWSASKCAPYLSKPKPSDHKYRRGVLGCVTGSKQYPGAALLTTSAALSVGIGMVRYFGPDSVKKAVLQNRPEVVIQTGNVDAYLLGSGIPARKSLLRKITMEMANRADVPKVLDAGAL